MDRQQRRHAHGCSENTVATASRVAGVGADAGGRVHRSQRGVGGQGVRVVLPAGDRRRRVHARRHPRIARQLSHVPARPPRRRPDSHPRSVRVVRRASAGDRRARARAHDLLRQFVHDGVAARLLPRMAATAPRRCRRVLAWLGVPGRRAGGHGAARWVRRRRRWWVPSRPLRHCGAGGDVGVVVVQCVVSAARRGAGASACADRCDHRRGDGGIRRPRQRFGCPNW